MPNVTESGLTNFQVDFIAENFFKNPKYNGWYNIAISLIKNGKCIVPKHSGKIWFGGIGNFIKESEVPPHLNVVDCIMLTFDAKEFISSPFFFDYKYHFIENQETNVNHFKVELEKEEKNLSELKQLFPM